MLLFNYDERTSQVKQRPKTKKRGFKAGTKQAKLAGQLAKYARAHATGNNQGKREARNAIADMIGI